MQIDPYNVWQTVTPSDTVDFDRMTDAIRSGSNGVMVIVAQDGSTAAFHVVTGDIIPVKARRVNATNTTASNIVALYRQ